MSASHGPDGNSADRGLQDLSQQATSSGQARVNQVGRDQYNYATVQGESAPQALEAVPAAVDLVGRAGPTAELLDVLDPAGTGPGTVLVTGLAGIGKTALALHAARQAGSHGWFAGGTLFVHLRGYDPAGAITGAHALEALLRALGVRGEDLPPTPWEQENLYRSQLALRSRTGPVLIVADDASSTDQLRPLIPAQPRHRLLATSRDDLAGPHLPARLISLDQLDAGPAADLIAGTLTRARPADARPLDEPDALAEVAALCGYLPLALTIAAAQLTADPGLPLHTLAADLSEARTRLQTLRHQEQGGRSLGMQAAFDLSYRRLEDQPAQVFRLLSLNPSPDVSTETTAVLADRPVRAARQDLAALARAGLLSEQPVGSGRWRMHDLTRLYADGQCHRNDRAASREEALGRLLDHYRDTTRAADDHLRARRRQNAANRFAALAWLDAERLNLTATVTLAAAHGQPRTTLTLAGDLHVYLRERRYFHDTLTIAQHGLTTARELGDRHSEALALGNLGLALQEVRRFEEAIDNHTKELATIRELGERHNEAAALTHLGLALQGARRFEEAIDSHTRAVAIVRELADRDREGLVLTNLGLTLREVRRFEEAIDAHTQGLALFLELGDRYGEGMALDNIGLAAQGVRKFGEAIDSHTQAATIFHELEDRYREAAALTNLGLALRQVEQFREAIDAHTQALAMCGELGDRHREAVTLNHIGLALKEAGQVEEAIDTHCRAATTFHELGDRHWEAVALHHLGVALKEVRRFEEAVNSHTRAATLFHEAGDRPLEAMALDSLGMALQDAQQLREAIDTHTRAATLFHELSDRPLEARALVSLGLALQRVGQFEEAIDTHTKAVVVCGELGDRHREAATLDFLGLALRAAQRFEEAIDTHTKELAICREMGDRHNEARALNHLGIAFMGVGRFDEAASVLTRAADNFGELGDDHREAAVVDNLGIATNAIQQSRGVRALWRRLTRWRGVDGVAG
ncbi:tetratricopeptide repeat protein [Streptomyces sp. NPDC057301]|uniref:tetratricopeptide repeat protein n=1 Tax=Streptomyces sp. NPDC057301 TaxID=3346093 RepID=UPI0036422FC6